jgi:hypothetical protein
MSIQALVEELFNKYGPGHICYVYSTLLLHRKSTVSCVLHTSTCLCTCLLLICSQPLPCYPLLCSVTILLRFCYIPLCFLLHLPNSLQPCVPIFYLYVGNHCLVILCYDFVTILLQFCYVLLRSATFCYVLLRSVMFCYA